MARALLALLILAAAEIYLLLAIGEAIGATATLGILVVAAVGGYFAARAQGLQVIRRWGAVLAAGASPTEGLIDGFLVLLGGALLVLPGVISDVLGLLLLVPPVRRLVATRIRRRAEAWVAEGSVQIATQVRVMEIKEIDPQAEAPREVIDVEGYAVEARPERLLGEATKDEPDVKP